MDKKTAEDNITKGETRKELKFTESTTEFKSGVEIYTWSLEPQNVKLRGIIFVSHGFGEHSRRYDNFARLLSSELGIVVISHDHVGHGRSGGERTIIDTFDTYVDDVFAHLDEKKKLYPDIPVYLFGHSMGGSIAILTACRKPDYFKAVALSAPGIITDPSIEPSAFKMFVGRIMNHFFPRMESLPPVDPMVLSSDPNQVEAYRTDPLVDHNGVKLRFVMVFSDTVEKIKQLIPSIQWPFLVIHGDDDKLTYIGGSQFLEKEAKSKDKEIKIYKGLKHEMLNEVKEEADKVMSDIVEWLRQRIPTD